MRGLVSEQEVERLHMLRNDFVVDAYFTFLDCTHSSRDISAVEGNVAQLASYGECIAVVVTCPEEREKRE